MLSHSPLQRFSGPITHAALDTLIILIVLVVFGAATSPWAALAAIPLLIGSAFIAGLSLGFTAHIHDIDAFNIYMAAFFTVMLICGAWFPVDVLPVWLRWIAYAIPLTESIDLTRALLTGRFLSRHAYEAAYLVISAVVACEWAMRSLRRRMVASKEMKNLTQRAQRYLAVSVAEEFHPSANN